MKSFRRILAPTDLSPESLSAVLFASHLGKSQSAELTVLHVATSTSMVYQEMLPPVDLSFVDDEIESQARAHLEKWARRNLRNYEKLKLLVRSGPAADTICEMAEETRANLIVMATHGRVGVRHFVLGSITEHVLRRAPCPVLTVNPELKKAVKKRRTAR
jgi:nucleotide-binding universal stress UspA family protein